MIRSSDKTNQIDSSMVEAASSSIRDQSSGTAPKQLQMVRTAIIEIYSQALLECLIALSDDISERCDQADDR